MECSASQKELNNETRRQLLQLHVKVFAESLQQSATDMQWEQRREHQSKIDRVQWD